MTTWFDSLKLVVRKKKHVSIELAVEKKTTIFLPSLIKNGASANDSEDIFSSSPFPHPLYV